MSENGHSLRKVIIEYVQERKNGKRQSKVTGGADLLTLFMENGDVFTDEVIVDELIDFFSAAVLTSQYATQTLITHLYQSSSSVKKIREEFIRIASNVPGADKRKLMRLSSLD